MKELSFSARVSGVVGVDWVETIDTFHLTQRFTLTFHSSEKMPLSTAALRDRIDSLDPLAAKASYDAKEDSLVVPSDSKEGSQVSPTDLPRSKKLLSPSLSRVAEGSRSGTLMRRPLVMTILR